MFESKKFLPRREGSESPRAWRLADGPVSLPKGLKEKNEDGFVATDNCYAVLDGVSSIYPNELLGGKTPGQFAVEVGKRVLSHLPDDIDPHALPQLLTKALHGALPERNDTGELLANVPSFVFVAFLPKHNCIVRVGDCSYLINGVGENPDIPPDRAKQEVRKRTIKKIGASVQDVLANDPTRERMRNMRTWQQIQANSTADKSLGYGVINGSNVPDEYVRIVDVPAHADSIVLASDGYPAAALRDSFDETERATRTLLLQDPLGIGEAPAVAPHKLVESDKEAFFVPNDDRTYLRLTR